MVFRRYFFSFPYAYTRVFTLAVHGPPKWCCCAVSPRHTMQHTIKAIHIYTLVMHIHPFLRISINVIILYYYEVILLYIGRGHSQLCCFAIGGRRTNMGKKFRSASPRGTCYYFTTKYNDNMSNIKKLNETPSQRLSAFLHSGLSYT